MSYIKIMVHLIWATKNREHLIDVELRPLIINHIKENSISKGIFIDTLNCVSDHVHLLVSLGSEQTISKIAHLLKGESSNWINKQYSSKKSFDWQDEYFAVSVGQSGIEKVRAYIKNQEEHHRKKSFSEECEELLSKYEFVKFVK